MSDRQPDPRPVLYRLRKNVPRWLQQANDLRAIFGPLLHLVKIVVVCIERVIGFLVGPIIHARHLADIVAFAFIVVLDQDFCLHQHIEHGGQERWIDLLAFHLLDRMRDLVSQRNYCADLVRLLAHSHPTIWR